MKNIDIFGSIMLVLVAIVLVSICLDLYSAATESKVSIGDVWTYPNGNGDPWEDYPISTNVILDVKNGYVLYFDGHLNRTNHSSIGLFTDVNRFLKKDKISEKILVAPVEKP